MEETREFTEFENLYKQMTVTERREMAVIMLKMIKGKILELCRSNPKHLESLPVDKLRDVAQIVQMDARKMIFSSLQDTGASFLIPVLDAYEALSFFSVSQNDQTAADLREIIEDIQTVWKAENKIKADSTTITSSRAATDQKPAGVVPACSGSKPGSLTDRAAPGVDSHCLTAPGSMPRSKPAGVRITAPRRSKARRVSNKRKGEKA